MTKFDILLEAKKLLLTLDSKQMLIDSACLQVVNNVVDMTVGQVISDFTRTFSETSNKVKIKSTILQTIQNGLISDDKNYTLNEGLTHLLPRPSEPDDLICNICNESEGYKCNVCEFYLCGFCLHELNDKSVCPQCRTKGRKLVDKEGDTKYDPYHKKDKPPKIGELAEKYFDLVWFARRSPDDMPEESKKPHDEIFKKYPKEIKKLEECDEERSSMTPFNWQHSFNSGVLATLRLIDGGKIRYEDWEEFPMLDT